MYNISCEFVTILASVSPMIKTTGQYAYTIILSVLISCDALSKKRSFFMSKKKNTMSAKAITISAMIAALYVVLSYICESLGLLRYAVQLRIPEALCVLCAFTPYAIPGMTLGCFLTNLLTGCAAIDIIVGPIATFLGAVCGRIIASKMKHSPLSLCLATIPTFLFNTLLMPPVIMYAYGSEYALPLVFVTVGAGELISAVILGTLFGVALNKSAFRI